jgi:uncharacterized Zn finger protein
MARRRSSYDFFEFPPSSTPRPAKGGIKAQTKRGAFGASWWAKRWIAVLESLHVGGRLQRGRNYARRGQVLSIDVAEGSAKAKVQGSRPRPYEVEIAVKTLSKQAWKKLAEVLSGQAVFAARLLAGEMPEAIEEAFDKAGLSLFPASRGDLATSCSCPDWSNPCKHVAAVYYLLGEEFDRDPFLIFKLRGMEREELMALVARSGPPEPAAKPPPAPEPLPADPEDFWGKTWPEDDLGGEVLTPNVAAALPKRLGGFPFWRGDEDFLPALEGVYREASAVGLDVLSGPRPAED